jgi:hypothetical protein
MRLDDEERLILEYLYDHPRRALGLNRNELFSGSNIRRPRDGEVIIQRLLGRELVRWNNTYLRLTPDGEAVIEQHRSRFARFSRSPAGKLIGSFNAMIDEWPHVWRLLAWLFMLAVAFVLGRVT